MVVTADESAGRRICDAGMKMSLTQRQQRKQRKGRREGSTGKARGRVRKGQDPAPTELASVEPGFLHYRTASPHTPSAPPIVGGTSPSRENIIPSVLPSISISDRDFTTDARRTRRRPGRESHAEAAEEAEAPDKKNPL